MMKNSCNGVKVSKVHVRERQHPVMQYLSLPNGRSKALVRDYNSARTEYQETTRVYVSPKNQTLGEQMATRRASPSATFKRLVQQELANAGYTGKVRYSRYAGCKMCPCSPGFVLETNLDQDFPVDVWLTVSVDE
jgi:hypothetical protein